MTCIISPSRPLAKYAAVSGCSFILQTTRLTSSLVVAGFTAPGDRRFLIAIASWALDNSLQSARSLDSFNTGDNLAVYRHPRVFSAVHWVD